MVTMVAGRIYLGAAASVPPEPRIVKPQQKISLPGIDFKQSQKTLLLVLSSTCPFCSRSMPFYQRMMQSKGEHARVIVVGGEDEKTLSNYLRINEVPVDGIATVTAANTPSQVTTVARAAAMLSPVAARDVRPAMRNGDEVFRAGTIVPALCVSE